MVVGTHWNPSHAFSWSNGVITNLAQFPEKSAVVSSISPDGLVIVGSSIADDDVHLEAVRWTNDTQTGPNTIIRLGDLPGGLFWSEAEDVSLFGYCIVGWSKGTNGTEACRWVNNVISGLGDLPGAGFYSKANAVSDNGTVIVGISSSVNGYEACRWANNVITGLGDLPGGEFRSEAIDISPDSGAVVGQSTSANGDEAFLWMSLSKTMIGLGDLPGGIFFSSANGVSAYGKTVVGRSNGYKGNEAFYWTKAHGMQSISALLISAGVNLTGFVLYEATAISADGKTIVGNGTFFGKKIGWMVSDFPF